MEEKREELLVRDDTAKYQDYKFDSVFMAAISEVCQILLDAGYEPFEQLTGYIQTGNDQYITRRGNARKIVTEMDTALIRKYLRQYGHIYVMRR